MKKEATQMRAPRGTLQEMPPAPLATPTARATENTLRQHSSSETFRSVHWSPLGLSGRTRVRHTPRVDDKKLAIQN